MGLMPEMTMTRKDRSVEDGRPEDQPLVFWRETDGRRTGLACLTTFCDNPDCTCQEAHIQAYEVDDSFVKLSVRDDHVQVIFDRGDGPAPKGRAIAIVDLETGRLDRMGSTSPRKRRNEFRQWLEEAIDDAVLADLRARWRSYKEALRRAAGPGTVDKWREMDWTWWDGEEPVGWHEVHPESPDDRYHVDGTTYDAVDYYCLLPECDCDQVTVRFFRAAGKKTEVVGEVFVEPRSREVVGTTNAPGKRRVLDHLWSAFEASRELALLSNRFREMRSLGPQILALRERQLRPAAAPGDGKIAAQDHQLKPATVRREAKIGRNAPCPCGSGRKYKKCCGRNV